MGDRVDVTRQVDWLTAGRTSAFRRLPRDKHRRFRWVMSYRSPRNVIVIGALERLARHCEDLSTTSVPIRRHAPREAVRACLYVSLRVFTCLYCAGKGRDCEGPEGIETLLPGQSSERIWSKG